MVFNPKVYLAGNEVSGFFGFAVDVFGLLGSRFDSGAEHLEAAAKVRGEEFFDDAFLGRAEGAAVVGADDVLTLRLVTVVG